MSQQASYKIAKAFLSESVIIQWMWNYLVQIGEPILNPRNVLKNIIRLKKLEQINAYLNINSFRNKCDSLVTIAHKNIDVFLISKLKFTFLFPQLSATLKGTPHHID